MALSFLASQLALALTAAFVKPQFFNPEYGIKLQRLRELMQEHQGRQPDLLVLGGSRTSVGVKPGVLLENWSRDSHPPLVFNFGVFASGPLLQRVTLERLLADGVQPRRLLLEIWPPTWAWEPTGLKHLAEGKPTPFACQRLLWSDLRMVDKHWKLPWTTYTRWASCWCFPAVSFRFNMQNELAPGLGSHPLEDDITWHGMDRFGWIQAEHYSQALTAERWTVVRSRARELFVPILEGLYVSPVARQALSGILDTCRSRGIEVTLLYAPETAEFRAWSTERSRAVSAQFLRELTESHALPLVDARDWSDEGSFADFIHLTREGAEKFSSRLARALSSTDAHGPGGLTSLAATAVPARESLDR